MNLLKLWKITKGRNERLGLISVKFLDLVREIAKIVPYALAYRAGVNPVLLVVVYAAVYGLGHLNGSLAQAVGEMIGRRQAKEQHDALKEKLKEKLEALFSKQGQRATGNLFELPSLREAKKAGGIN